jgi:hypothetical protein
MVECRPRHRVDRQRYRKAMRVHRLQQVTMPERLLDRSHRLTDCALEKELGNMVERIGRICIISKKGSGTQALDNIQLDESLSNVVADHLFDLQSETLRIAETLSGVSFGDRLVLLDEKVYGYLVILSYSS